MLWIIVIILWIIIFIIYLCCHKFSDDPILCIIKDNDTLTIYRNYTYVITKNGYYTSGKLLLTEFRALYNIIKNKHLIKAGFWDYILPSEFKLYIYGTSIPISNMNNLDPQIRGDIMKLVDMIHKLSNRTL